MWAEGDLTSASLIVSADWLCVPSPCCAWIVGLHGPGAIWSARRQLRHLRDRCGLSWVAAGTENPSVAPWADRLGLQLRSTDGFSYGRYFGTADGLLSVLRSASSARLNTTVFCPRACAD